MLKKYNKELKFLVSGGSSTLIDFIIYMVVSSKLNVKISKFISMLIASIYSFVINKKWTFNNSDNISFDMIIKYIVCQILNILINTYSNSYIYELTNHKIISFIFATGIAMIFNFLFQNYVVFNNKNRK